MNDCGDVAALLHLPKSVQWAKFGAFAGPILGPGPYL